MEIWCFLLNQETNFSSEWRIILLIWRSGDLVVDQSMWGRLFQSIGRWLGDIARWLCSNRSVSWDWSRWQKVYSGRGPGCSKWPNSCRWKILLVSTSNFLICQKQLPWKSQAGKSVQTRNIACTSRLQQMMFVAAWAFSFTFLSSAFSAVCSAHLKPGLSLQYTFIFIFRATYKKRESLKIKDGNI